MKCKLVPVLVIKTHTGSGGTDPLILNLDSVDGLTLGPLYP